MRAELRRLHSPDIDDLWTHLPDDPGYFGFLIQALIGPDDGTGEESFDFLVCSPRWLATKLEGDEYVWGRYYLFLKWYDPYLITQAIEKLCHSIDGPDWETIASRLSQSGRWEFEDYHE
jgi:hypothetical protein